MPVWPPRTVIRKSAGLRTLESALYRGGLGPVAGVDEVGRGACAGPLVVAACVLGPNRLESLAALDDSKKLNEAERERLFPIIRRYALAYHVVFIPSNLEKPKQVNSAVYTDSLVAVDGNYDDVNKLASEIAGAHGGWLSVESGPEATAFVFRFPGEMPG